MKPKVKKFSLLLSIALFLLSGSSINAQKSKYDEAISDDLLKLGQEKLDLIKNELSASDKNEWAGIYGSVQGTTISTTLGWTENSCYFTRRYKCSRPWTERINYGAVEFSNNRLKIYPALNENEKSSHIEATEFIPIKWDERHFLIPQEKLINFAYAVYSNSESQIESFFSKNGDSDKSRKNLPDLPKEFEKFLTMKAIEPKITTIKKTGENIWNYEITLNKGRAANVIERMFFYVTGSSDDLKLMIKDVQENTSKAVIVSVTNDAEPKIGMKFTSKLPKNYIEN